MIKTTIQILCLSLSWSGFAQNVGMHTHQPNVDLEIATNVDDLIPNGLMVPKISGMDLKNKDLLYNSDQDGIMVFVFDPLLIPDIGGKTEKVTEQGYYYYDAMRTKWEKLDRYTNVVAEKTILKIDKNVQQQVMNTGTAVSWNAISGKKNSDNDVLLTGVNQSVISIAPGKSYKLMAMVGIGSNSESTYLKTQFKLVEPLTANAQLYFSSPGTSESSSLANSKGAGTYAVCYLYSGDLGIKLMLEARGPLGATVTYIAGQSTGQQEGTLIVIQEL